MTHDSFFSTLYHSEPFALIALLFQCITSYWYLSRYEITSVVYIQTFIKKIATDLHPYKKNNFYPIPLYILA